MIPGERTKDHRTGVTVISRTERFWRPPGNDRASMITMIASMYPTVARKLARNFSTGVPYPHPPADRPTQRPAFETFDRKTSRTSGGALIIAVALSAVTLSAKEGSHIRSPGHQRKPARTEVLLSGY